MRYFPTVKAQPLIIYKTKLGVPVETRRFSSMTGKNGAYAWLRSEGCQFRNGIFCRLENESVELTTMEFEYEVEAATLGISAIRKKGRAKHGDVED